MNMRGRHVLITGGTSGIGRELVKHLIAQNKVSVIARPSKVLDEFRLAFPEVHVFEADLSDLGSVSNAASAIVEEFSAMDVLINNAGIQHTPKFTDADFDVATIQREIDVNFTSICVLIAKCLPVLSAQKEAVILNINSGLGLAPKTNSAVYCGTKGGLNLFSQSLRYQLEDTSVRVKQAFLPLVDTNMTKGRGSGKISAAQAATEIIAGIQAKRPDFGVGKAKLLMRILRMSPSIAKRIMKAA